MLALVLSSMLAAGAVLSGHPGPAPLASRHGAPNRCEPWVCPEPGSATANNPDR